MKTAATPVMLALQRRQRRLTASIIATTIGAALLLSCPTGNAAELRYTLVADFPNAHPSWLRMPIVSPDQRRVAIVYTGGGEQFVSINGSHHAKFSRVIPGSMRWMPDSSDLLYVGERGGTQYLVRQGSETQLPGSLPAPGQLPRNPVISADGSRLLMVVSSGGRHQLLLDGLVVATHDKVLSFGFAGATNEYFATVRDAGLEWIVDSAFGSGPKSPGVNPPIFGSGSSNYLYWREGDKATSVITMRDGSPVGVHEGIATTYAISPDGRRVLWLQPVRTEAGEAVVMRVTGLPPKLILTDRHTSQVAFSPDSKRVIYTAPASDMDSVVVDGVESSPWAPESTATPVWSEDGSSYAYIASDSPPKRVVVRNGVASKSYRGVVAGSLLFSRDGKSLSFVIGDPAFHDRFQMVTDGLVAPDRYEQLTEFVYSSSGTIAYLGKKNLRRYAVLGKSRRRIIADSYIERTLRAQPDGSVTFLTVEGSTVKRATFTP